MGIYMATGDDYIPKFFDLWADARDYFVSQKHAVIYQKQNEDYYLEIRRK